MSDSPLSQLQSLTALPAPAARALLADAGGDLALAVETFLAGGDAPTHDAQHTQTEHTQTTHAERAKTWGEAIADAAASAVRYILAVGVRIYEYFFPPTMIQDAVKKTPLLIQVSLRQTDFISSANYLGFAARTNLSYIHIPIAKWEAVQDQSRPQEKSETNAHDPFLLRRLSPGFQLSWNQGRRIMRIQGSSCTSVMREVDSLLHEYKTHPGDLNDAVRDVLPHRTDTDSVRRRTHATASSTISSSARYNPISSGSGPQASSTNSSIIREQQSAYERSLMADQQKELEKQRLLGEAELKIEAEKDRTRQRERYISEMSVRSEPSSEATIQITFKFADGNSVPAKFDKSEKIETLYRYIAAQSICTWEVAPTNDILDEFYLTARFPARKFLDRSITLEAAGLRSDEALFVNQRDMEQDE